MNDCELKSGKAFGPIELAAYAKSAPKPADPAGHQINTKLACYTYIKKERIGMVVFREFVIILAKNYELRFYFEV